MSLVDIIIPVFNRSDLLQRCLEYIPEACKENPYSIYVLDNGSQVSAGMIGAQAAPPINEAVRIREICTAHKAFHFRQGTNMGFPAGCNYLAKKGTSPLIFFLNDDVFLLPGSIDKLVRVMDDPSIGVAGMKLLFPLDSQDPIRPAGKIQHVGISTNIRGDFFHQYISWSPENPRTRRLKYPIAVTGAAMMTRRKIFRDAGGFFEGYGLGTYEDIEYCFKVRELGYNIYIEHEAIGFHLTGATVTSQNMSYQLNANRDLFRVRWKDKIFYTEWENW
jgi:GT2 family glycosyltransferase